MNTSDHISLLTRIKENYDYVFVDLRDKRVDDWAFMWSPWPTLASCMVYYYVMRVAGPRFMKNREPFEIKNIMIVYNFFQTLFSLWIFQKAARFWLTGKYNWLCQPVDYSETQDGYDALDMTWWYFFSKYIDYLDSLFFVLRKKFSHLSTLHVVHHGIMPFTAWWGIRFVGGGHTTFCGFLNMGVHVVMYFYYFLSAFGPRFQKYLWWKRYLTTMQLVQFVTFFIHATLPLFMSDCDFPKVFSYVILFHGAMFFVMFAHFYIQAYGKKGAKKEPVTDINANGVQTKQSNGVHTKPIKAD
eukprot:TRINITY_DN12281_c2_g1_i2.p1 TRINITY_DN12281_c2_g1~~TRINITY_DN12281_c2_g1_i2.p1  ORF type:complete len:299 (-),score=45.62 TRINITY_DN12281_c2_g1_i2:2113-3009(-)